MLKRFRIIGLCLVAVFALSAAGASTASAHLKWWLCLKEGAGHAYKDAECKEKTGGEYEWRVLPEGKANFIELTAKLPVGKPAKLHGTIFGFIKETVECETIALKHGTTVYGIVWNETSGSARDEGVVEFSKCKSAKCTTFTEPIRVPENGEGLSVLVSEKPATPGSGEIREPYYDDSLPEGTTQHFTTIHCSNPIAEDKVNTTIAINKNQPGEVNEGEAGETAKIVEPKVHKVIHKFIFECPPSTMKVLNWKGTEIKVNELNNENCFEAEVEVEVWGGTIEGKPIPRGTAFDVQ